MTDPVEEEPPAPSAVSGAAAGSGPAAPGCSTSRSTSASGSSSGERLGGLFDSFGKRVRLVHADRDGIVVGRTEAPLVNRGDAVVHIAEIDEPSADPLADDAGAATDALRIWLSNRPPRVPPTSQLLTTIPVPRSRAISTPSGRVTPAGGTQSSPYS